MYKIMRSENGSDYVLRFEGAVDALYMLDGSEVHMLTIPADVFANMITDGESLILAEGHKKQEENDAWFNRKQKEMGLWKS